MAQTDQTRDANLLSLMRSLGLTRVEAECVVDGVDADYRFELEMYAYYVHRDAVLAFWEARRAGRDLSGMVAGPASIKLATIALNNAIGFASR